MMKKRLRPRGRLVLTVVLTVLAVVSVTTPQAVAQPVDSLVFDSVGSPAGQAVALPLNLYNASTFKAMSLPFVYPTDKVSLDSIGWSGGRVDYIGAKTLTHDSAAGQMLLGVLPILEPLIGPGRGVLTRLHFQLLPGAVGGDVIVVDSQFMPPSGSFLLPDETNTPVPFAFARGTISVTTANTPPTVSAPAEVFVDENELLQFSVTGSDADGDTVMLAVSGAPVGAAFADSGNGVAGFEWTPEYVGPSSSANSPFILQFLVTDGTDGGLATTTVNVINVNRPPVLTLPSTDSVGAGDPVSVAFSGADPDGDVLTPQVVVGPAGVSIGGANPWTLSWTTTEADTGVHTVRISITDEAGGADTGEVAITVTPQPAVLQFTLDITDTNSILGGTVDVPINLTNAKAIGGFDLHVTYDLSALVLNEIDYTGTRVEGWEFLTASFSTDFGMGRIRMVGIADQQNAVVTPPLGPGDGAVAILRFWVTSDGAFVDQFVPVSFLTEDPGDNVLSDPSGDTTYMQSEINYANGGVLIQQVQGVMLGDINLNGVAFEIGDAVRFANYFINSVLYPLDARQRANSDVNEDGLMATVGDLVYLIDAIVNNTNAPPSPGLSEAGEGGAR